jgi:hypothetical protein
MTRSEAIICGVNNGSANQQQEEEEEEERSDSYLGEKSYS